MQPIDEPALWRRIAQEYAVEREERAALRNLRLDSPDIGDVISAGARRQYRDIPSEATILDKATRAWSDARHDAAFRQHSALQAPDLYPQLRLPKPQQRVDEPALWRQIAQEYAVEREERAALRNLRLDSPNIGDFISKSLNYNRIKLDEPGAWRLGTRVYEADAPLLHSGYRHPISATVSVRKYAKNTLSIPETVRHLQTTTTTGCRPGDRDGSTPDRTCTTREVRRDPVRRGVGTTPIEKT